MIPRPAKKINTLRWVGIQGATLAQAAGSIAVAAVVAAGTPPETIMRTRGWFSAWLNNAQAPGQSVIISAGLILVPEGQGSTVIWDPFNDFNAPWFWFEEFTLGYEEGVTDVTDIGISKRFVEVDSKAMRRASGDEEVQLVVTNTTLGSASQVDTSLTGRMLLGR